MLTRGRAGSHAYASRTKQGANKIANKLRKAGLKARVINRRKRGYTGKLKYVIYLKGRRKVKK